MNESATMDLWTFAMRLYESAGVQRAALELQDADAVDVNMILYAAWCGAQRGLALAPADFEAVEAVAGPWRREVVLPLRCLRRRLKAATFSGFEQSQGSFRGQASGLEILAERLQLEAMSGVDAGTPARASAALALSNVEAMPSFAAVADVRRRNEALAALRLALDCAW